MRSLSRFLLPAFLALTASARGGISAADIAAAVDSGNSITWKDSADEWRVAPAGESHDGVDALRTPPVRTNGAGAIEGTVEGPGTLRGWVRVSSERWHDALKVEVHGVPVESFSGEENHSFAVPVPRGTHDVSFVWSKDASRREGADAAWVDEVRWERAVVSIAEALDVAGTANASRVTFSTPADTRAWQAIMEGGANAGGDALFAPSAGEGCKQLVTANEASLVTFWTQSPPGDAYYVGYLKVSPQGSAQLLSSEDSGPWKRWRVVLPAGAAVLVEIEPPWALFGTPSPETGFLLDNLTVEPLGIVSLAEALDAPGLTFTQEWSSTLAGLPAGDAWLAIAAPAASGLTAGGADAVLSLPPVNDTGPASSRFQVLRTTLTGPGRLTLRWRLQGGQYGDSTLLRLSLKSVATAHESTHGFYPAFSEWQQQSVEVPPGAQELRLTWDGDGDHPLLLDEFTFTSVPRAAVPPSVNEAADVSGITITAAGNWQPGQWNGAGFGNDDVLRWVPGGSDAPLTATFTGPGWLSMAWRANDYHRPAMILDGMESALYPISLTRMAADHAVPWQNMVRWLPAGAHTLSLLGDSDPNAPAEINSLDGLTFSTAPPAWVQGMEGNGITTWQMASPAWSVVTDVTHDGTDALRSPAAGATQWLALKATVQGPGTLRFWWRVGDPLPGSYGNAAQFFSVPVSPLGAPSIAGDSGWQQVVRDYPEDGEHVLRWDFRRSARATLPGDGLWLDEVSFTKASPVSIGTALDAPDLTWTSQGPFTALGGAGFHQSRGGAVVQLPADGTWPPPAAWLETTLPGPGLVDIKYNTGPGSSPFELWVDGALVYPVTGWHNPAKYEIFGAGPHVCRMVFPARHALMELDSFQYSPAPLMSLTAALDVPQEPAQKLGAFGLQDAAAAHDGADVALLAPAESYNGRAELRWLLRAPARVSFWWRGEGAADGSALANSYLGGPGSRQGPFGWEEMTLTLAGNGMEHCIITVEDGESEPYHVWIDQVRIEPYAAVTLAEALHLPAGSVTSGGTGEWLSYRPPGAAGVDDGAYAAGFLNGTRGPMWLEARVTGPALLHYHTEKYPYSPAPRLTVTRTPVAAGVAITAGEQGPLGIPPGEHFVLWAVQADHSGSSTVPALQLSGVRLVPPLAIAPQLGQPGLTFTTTPSPDGLWYGDVRRPHDSLVFSDDTVVRVAGTATLETTLTGPGWLLFEAEMAPKMNSIEWPPGSGLDVRLLPSGPAPDPLPEPVLKLDWTGTYYGQPRTERVAQNVWIPAGPSRVQFKGRNAATLNNFRFVPGMDGASAAAALDLPQGAVVSFPSNKGGAVAAPITHDGTDSLQLVAGQPTNDPLLSLSFTGPAVVSGWVRNGKIKPYIWAPDFDPASPPEPGVVWDGSRYGLRVFQNGTRLGLPEEDEIAPGEWSSLRIPVPAGGPQVISFGLATSTTSEPHEYVLQLDELAVTPLAPVTLGEALDAPGLTWTAAPQSWSGGASAIASPDGTDAVWVVASENSPRWLETTVTGPGALRFWSWGGGNLDLTVGGLPQQPLTAYDYSFEDTGTLWRSQLIPVPQGTHTVRLEPADWEWFGETAIFGLDHMQWEPGATTTLAAALDLPAHATLTTGGADAAAWIGTVEAALSHDGTDVVSIRAPLTESAWLEVSMTGPATVSFWQAIGPGADVSFTLDDGPVRPPGNGGFGLIFGNDDVAPRGARDVDPPDPPQEEMSGWYREEFAVPAGTHTLRWTVAAHVEAWGQPLPGELLFSLDELIIAPLPAPVSLADALDVTGLTVTTNRPDKVYAVTVPGMAHDAVDSVVVTGTGSYDEPDQARLTLTVPGAGLVRYRWRRLGTSDSYSYPQALVQGLVPDDAMRHIGASGGWQEWREAWLLQPLPGSQQVAWHIKQENHGFVLDEVSFSNSPDVPAATGAPELTWTTGSGSDWMGLPPLPEGSQTRAAAAFSMVPQGQTGWIGTSLQGPGRLTFTAREARFLFDGLEHYDFGFNTDAYTLVVPPGIHVVRWQAEGRAQMSLSSVRWAPSAAVDPIADALDAPSLAWLFLEGHGTWTVQTTETTDGQDALRYTGVDGVKHAWIQTVLPLPGPAGAQYRRTGRFNSTGAEPAWTAWGGGIAVPGPRTMTLDAWTTVEGGPGTVDFDAFYYTPVPASLADALDAPGQVWETSAELPFIGYASSDRDLAFDRTDAVIARNGAPGAWLQTTVTGPARISFFSSGTGGIFTVAASVPPLSSSSGWSETRFEVGAGTHVLRWQQVNGNPWGIDAFSVTPLAAGASLADALDHPGPWYLPEASTWTVSTTDTAGGPDAAVFTTAHYYYPLELSVQGPGRLEFHARMPRSSNGFNGSNPFVSAPPSSWPASFTGAWQHFVIDSIPPGPQPLRWHLQSGIAGEVPPAFDAVSFSPYAGVSLSVALDDRPGLTFATNPAAPWAGYATGAAAADGADAVLSSTSQDSWLEINAPPGAGELTFMARAPGANGTGLRMPDGSYYHGVPRQWKRIRASVSAETPRPLRITAELAVCLWLDDMQWTSASGTLAAWLAVHNLPADSAMNSDADGDGQPLVFEYAFGLDPNSHGASDPAAPAEAGMPVFDYTLRPDPGPSEPPVLRCRYLRRSGGNGLRYDVYFYSNPGLFSLPNGNYQTEIEELNNDWELVSVYDQYFYPWERPATRFGRVRVTYAP